MVEEKPITREDVENMLRRPPTNYGKVKILSKNTPLDKHMKLLDKIIRAYG